MSPAYNPEASRRIIPVRVGATLYGLDVVAVRALVRIDKFESNNTGSEPCGWVRDPLGVVPVSDLGAVLGSSCEPKPGRRVVTIHGEGGTHGFLVDEVEPPMTLEADECFEFPVMSWSNGNAFTGVGIRDGRVVLLLDAEALLSGGSAPVVPRAESQPACLARPDSLKNRQLPSQREPTAAVRRLITFELPNVTKSLRLGLSARQVPEVVAPPAVVPVPGTLSHVCGITSWRNQPVVVIDLGVGLGLAPFVATQVPRLLITRTSRHRGLLGIPARADLRMVALRHNVDVSEAPLKVNRGLVRGVFDFEQQPLVIPDLDRLVMVMSDLGSIRSEVPRLDAKTPDTRAATP